jgi:hypothetical protein
MQKLQNQRIFLLHLIENKLSKSGHCIQIHIPVSLFSRLTRARFNPRKKKHKIYTRCHSTEHSHGDKVQVKTNEYPS